MPQPYLLGLFYRLPTYVVGTSVVRGMLQRLTENAGTRIDVASQPGEGSAFPVTFSV